MYICCLRALSVSQSALWASAADAFLAERNDMNNMIMDQVFPDKTLPTANIMEKEIPTITADTTLGKLLDILGLEPGQKRPQNTPKKATLLVMSGEPIVDMSGIKVFPNGYALYVNKLGKYSVVWIPYCTKFIYKFNELTDAEKQYLDAKKELSYDDISSCPWLPIITLFGEERITQKQNRGYGNKSINDDQENEEEPVVVEREDYDLEGKNFIWDDETLGVDPLDAVIRRETREEILSLLTDKQREVFVPYHKNGYSQQMIADKLGISKMSVCERLMQAKKKVEDYLRKNIL